MEVILITFILLFIIFPLLILFFALWCCFAVLALADLLDQRFGGIDLRIRFFILFVRLNGCRGTTTVMGYMQ